MSIEAGITWGEVKEQFEELAIADHVKIKTGVVIRLVPDESTGGGNLIAINTKV